MTHPQRTPDGTAELIGPTVLRDLTEGASMTLTDALTTLRNALPANPALDDDHQTAERTVLDAIADDPRTVAREALGWVAFYVDSDGCTEDNPNEDLGLVQGYRPAGGFE